MFIYNLRVQYVSGPGVILTHKKSFTQDEFRKMVKAAVKKFFAIEGNRILSNETNIIVSFLVSEYGFEDILTDIPTVELVDGFPDFDLKPKHNLV